MPTSRAPRQRFDRNYVDLGVEPPLRADGETSGAEESTPVSLRWLAGTVLTALAGLSLMGGAVYAALDGTTRLAGAPDGLLSDASLIGQHERRLTNVARKADRIMPTDETWEARQQVRLTSATRVGEREVLRIRPVVRLVTRLSLTTTNRIAKIPAFNAAALMAESDDTNRGDQSPSSADGDVSYVIKDLASVDFTDAGDPSLSADDVISAVRQTAQNASHSNIQLASIQAGTDEDMEMGNAAFPNLGLASAATTMVVNRHSINQEADNEDGVRTVKISEPQRLDAVLRGEGANDEDTRAVVEAFGGSDGYGTIALEKGQSVEILMNQAADGPKRPARVRVYDGGTLMSAVALSDQGRYVAVDEAAGSDGPEIDDLLEDGRQTARLYESLYETTFRYDVPEDVVKEFLRVMSTDVDFQRRVASGDNLEIVYAEPEVASDMPEVLYAALTTGGESRRYYRYFGNDGEPAYFDENGRSARKFLMRKPLTAGIMRSGFGARNHPILRTAKMHTGVDWAAPRGTPIYATGNGTVESAKWDGGYGRHVRIQHANGYETSYAHMNAFAKGISAGVKVRQGQLIGYVGSTGLSTGPHVHYEVLVNGRFVDPNRIRVPREQELTGENLVAFQGERQRIDALLQPANAQRVAQGQ
ncbi:membrane protein [Agaricicola taiwanensis]|uniref:Membrane protein n=1 Tax=Agaricicola taiwanensis TaxID=591372 RepID=A0A8J3DZT3_9RHOB|nr:M23 family metallopeptidase [Agaricicola taiwanensis]GGE55483.1 membrane protein [Agaricicola taiwanensis]